MRLRVSPLWWPALAVASPALGPYLVYKGRRFVSGRRTAEALNAERIAHAPSLPLPPLRGLDLTVLVDGAHEEGFLQAPGVSYLVKTSRGSVLMDVAFGGHCLACNAAKLGVALDVVDALLISHLHPDHMGGMAAQRTGRVIFPDTLGQGQGKPCYLPASAEAPGFDVQVVEKPRLIEAGLATTGPLARMLFFLGLCEEQALIADVHGKGLVLICGCGHFTLPPLFALVRKIAKAPIYAVVGGLHLPVTDSPSHAAGIQVQRIFGTGKTWHQPINESDLDNAIAAIREARVQRLLLSPHDSCLHAIDRLRQESGATVEVLHAGAHYTL